MTTKPAPAEELLRRPLYGEDIHLALQGGQLTDAYEFISLRFP